MPGYEYICKDCERAFTVYLSLREFEAKPQLTCPHCESTNVERILSSFFAKTSRKS